MFTSFRLQFKLLLYRSIKWTLTSYPHVVFRLNLFYSFLESPWLGELFLKYFKISLDVRFYVLFVTFQGMIEHMDS